MSEHDDDLDAELDDLEPVDPDIQLITDWLARELSPSEDAAVTRRLKTDFAFYEKVAPVMKIWHFPVDFRGRKARAEEDPRPSAVERTARPYGDDPPPPRRVRETGPGYHVPVAPEESATPVSPSAPSGQSVPIADDLLERRHRRAERRKTFLKRSYRVMNIAAGTVILVGFPLLGLYVRERMPRAVVTPRVERAPVPQGVVGTVVETGPKETKEIALKGGSLVVLRPGSKFTFGYIPGLRPLGVTAALDGEAAVVVTKEDRLLYLVTSSGRALLLPGSYAVRCEPSCAAMLVTVGAGIATLRGDTTTVGLQVKPGERGRVPRRGEPEKVTPGTGWPALEPLKPAGAPVKPPLAPPGAQPNPARRSR